MLVKFLARGTGSPTATADYLLGARDAAGQPREGIELLRGDPYQVAAMADTLDFKHKYTSGLIAWAAVPHRERRGGAHVHVLAARCDLDTGRSLNIAPPGWEKTFGPLRDAFNHEHGWSRPDDPARARVQQPGHRAYVEAARLRTGLGAGVQTPATSSGTTCSNGSNTAPCGTGPMSSPHCGRRASKCRGRARTTSPRWTPRPGTGGGRKENCMD